jgi:hypothetical protein
MFSALAACSSLLLIRSSFCSFRSFLSPFTTLNRCFARSSHKLQRRPARVLLSRFNKNIARVDVPKRAVLTSMGFQFFTNFATGMNDLPYRWQPFRVISPFVYYSTGYQNTCLKMLCISMSCFPAWLFTPWILLHNIGPAINSNNKK